MKSKIRHIAVFLLIIVLVCGTVGIMANHHICHRSSEVTVSLFIESSCEHEKELSSCSNIETDNKCCSEKDHSSENHSEFTDKISDRKCCYDFTEFHIFNFIYVIPEITLHNFSIPTPIILSENVLNTIDKNSFKNYTKSHILDFPKPPDKIIRFIHTITRIEPPFAS